MRKSLRAVLPAVAVLAVATVGQPAQAAGRAVLDQGHVDVVGVAYEESRLHLHVHDEESDTEYEPSAVNLVVKPGAEIAVPDDARYQFLGDPGDRAWVLPQTQDPELLFAGIAAEEVEPGTFRNDQLTVELVGVRGPAEVSLFTTDQFGTPTVLADSGDWKADKIAAAAGSHQHLNWGFEATGTYKLYFKASGVLAATGQKVSTPVEAFTFEVQQ